MDAFPRQPAFSSALLAVLVLSACAAGDAPAFASAIEDGDLPRVSAAKDRDSLGQRLSRSSDTDHFPRLQRQRCDDGPAFAAILTGCSWGMADGPVPGLAPHAGRVLMHRADVAFAQLPQPPPAA